MSLIPDLKQGFALVVAAPSGGGKTSLCDRLVAEEDEAVRSISATTRPKRKGEVPKKDYQFMSLKDFKELEDRGGFLESAEVYGNWYGTPRKAVQEAISDKKVVVMDLDVAGSLNVKKELQGDAVLVYVIPPSMEELERRLLDRAQNSEEDLKIRLKTALSEVRESHKYDYIIGNDNLETAYDHIRSVMRAELVRRSRLLLTVEHGKVLE